MEIIHITYQIIYEFNGWLFEYDRRKPFGPWPLKKDLEPRSRAGKKFYEMFEGFSSLAEVEQEKYRI